MPATADKPLGSVADECGKCLKTGEHPVFQNGPHRQVRCCECGTHIRNIGKAVPIQPAHKGSPEGIPITLLNAERDQLAAQAAISWLGCVERPTDKEIDQAINLGLRFADRFLSRRSA